MEGDGLDISELGDSVDFLEDAIAAEEHALRSYALTGNSKWIDIAQIVRKKRSSVLYTIVKPNNGESYCFSKHILGCAKRLREIANRQLDKSDKKTASEFLQSALDFETLFHYVNSMDTKKINKEVINAL